MNKDNFDAAVKSIEHCISVEKNAEENARRGNTNDFWSGYHAGQVEGLKRALRLFKDEYEMSEWENNNAAS